MIVFGAAKKDEDHSKNAIGCALMMQEITEELNKERIKKGLFAVRLRIGVNSGEMLAGLLGSKDRLEYTVIGDSVNLASRLCNEAKAHQTIIQTIASGKKTFSLEFFPPKSEKAIQQLQASSSELSKLNPDFVSITYGAGGSTRKSTFTYAEQLKADHGYKVMPHLTCVGHSKNELSEIIQQYQDAGFKTLMALRGDPQGDSQTFTPHPDGFQYANELVAFIKSTFPNFEIGVGGYPEKHPEAPSQESDIRNLKKKCDAGADFITTQLFYNNEHYFRFVDHCRSANIDCPIIPGLMIPTNLERVERFCNFCQAELPDSLKSALASAQDDAQALQAIGVDWTFQQVKDLLEQGAPGIHLYIMNQSKFMLALSEKFKEANIYFHN